MARLVWLALGLFLLALGAVVSPVPGPWSIPFVLLGLILVLRNSRWARRRYVGVSRRWPRWFALPNRMLRRRGAAAPSPARAGTTP